MTYILIFLLLLYFVYKYDVKESRDYRNTAFWGICVVFILLAALRYRIGGDAVGYSTTWHLYPSFWDFNWFHDIETCREANPDMERFQTGWFLFAMFVLGIWEDQIMMQIVIAILLNLAIFRCIKKYSRYPFITIFWFFCNFTFFELEFEAMRESVAVAIFLLLAFDNYVEKRWIKYYVGTVLAYMVHPSATLMFILPLFRNLNLSLFKNTLFFVIPPFAVAVAGRILLGSLLLSLINQDSYTGQYAMSAVERDFNSNYILLYLYKPLGLYLIVATCYKKIKGTFFSPLIFITLFCFFLSLVYFTGSRLANYIIIPTYIGLSPILYYWIKRFKSVMALVLIVVMINVSTVLLCYGTPRDKARYFPYQNIIFPDRTPEQQRIDREVNLH